MGEWFIVHWQSRVAEIRAYINAGPSSHRTIFRYPPGLLPNEGGFKLLDIGRPQRPINPSLSGQRLYANTFFLVA